MANLTTPDAARREVGLVVEPDPPSEVRRWSWAPLGVGLAGLALAALLAPAEPLAVPIELRWLAAYLLFVLLPGGLLVWRVLPVRTDARLEAAILAVASGYSLAVLLGLTLHALFRPVAPWQIAAGGGLLVLALALVAARHSGRPSGARRPETTARSLVTRLASARAVGRMLAGSWPLLLVLAVAAPLRLFDLGWSEFQGDEARVVLRALAALQGADGALAAHRKVPGEILLAYLFAGSLGQIVEHVARLPFALAGVGAVVAFFSLARALLGHSAALLAGLLLAVNGYFVAFGRILQYDSLAFFLGIAGLLSCWRFSQAAPAPGAADRDQAWADDRTPIAWAFLGALLLSGAALVALGAVFFVPPALLLAWPGLVWHVRCWRRARSWQVLAAWSWPIVPALLAAGLVLGASSSPAGPSGVWSYIGPRLGGDRPYWHGVLFLQSANHYLSSPYLLTMLDSGALAMLFGLLRVARLIGTRGGGVGLAVAILGAVAIVLAAVIWDRPHVAFAIGSLFALGLVLRAPSHHLGSQLGMRVALVWAAGPLFVHLLLIRVPGTHFREAFPGLILVLAALAVPALARPRSRLVVGALLGALIVGAGHYSWVTLVQRLPEYQLAYPTIRHPLDWTNRDGRGIGGLFGTVHRHGWKALGVVMAEGRLPGGYGTNESPAVAAWYLRRPQGCAGALDYVFRVRRAPHNRNLALPVPLPSDYQTRGQVREQRRATISIQLPPSSPDRVGDIAAEQYTARFDRELASVWRPIGELYRADFGATIAHRSCLAHNRPWPDAVKRG